MPVTAEGFARFFEALHGCAPYPWQERLARQAVEGRWPQAVDLPTGAGKTACIDVAIFALACQADRKPAERTAPVRIFFCVNRRVIVDEAYRRARRIAEKLREAEGPEDAPQILIDVASALRRLAGTTATESAPPLDVIELRGGVHCDNRWARSPVQPTVICTTIDQLGSRLLFRGYGVSPQAAPIQAALIAWDSLVLLDEAHISRPFSQTLDAVRGYLDPARWAEKAPLRRPMRVVPMTATPAQGKPEADDVLRMNDADRDAQHLARRLKASKPAELRMSSNIEHELVRTARRLAGDEPIALAVIVNRVARARDVWMRLREDATLRRKHPDAVIELVVGAIRPVDRARQAERLDRLIGSGRPERTTRTCIVVSTQCLEVGADYDFDALVTECASLDALRQRFGRLNRAGRPIEARAAIVVARSQVGRQGSDKRPVDPIYGQAIACTWDWLVSRSGGTGTVDFGIEAMSDVDLTAPDLARLLAPSSQLDAPILLPSHLDFWVQTSPVPVPDPEVSLFLHGPQRANIDVQVCWRADLEGAPETWPEAVALVPPSSSECMPVPLPRLRRWLVGEETGDDTGDLLGPLGERADGIANARLHHQAILWRGREQSKLLEDPSEIRPGDTLVIPASERGWAELGHIPGADDAEGGEGVATDSARYRWIDVAESAFRTSRARPLVRLRSCLRARWPEGAEWDALFDAAADPDAELSPREWEELLRAARDASEPGSAPRTALEELLRAGIVVRRYPDGHGVVLAGRRRLADVWWMPALDEGDDSPSRVRRRTPVRLADHLEHVREAMRTLSGLLPVGEFGEALEAAALLHDVGKADERFQALLLGADRTYAWLLAATDNASEPVAKSENVPQTRAERAALAERAGLPPGFRHEMLSLQLAEHGKNAPLPDDPWLRELTLHLIASHHGYARPFAPVAPDPEPPDVSFHLSLEGVERHFHAGSTWRREHPPHRIDSGVGERFWRLVRRHGWWGLAWFEALMRLADQYASAREERAEPAAVPDRAAEEAL